MHRFLFVIMYDCVTLRIRIGVKKKRHRVVLERSKAVYNTATAEVQQAT